MKTLKHLIYFTILMVGFSLTATAQKNDDQKNRPPKDPPKIDPGGKPPKEDRPKNDNRNNDNRGKKPQGVIYVSGNKTEFSFG
jgi:hypothetical protein